jgi:integrase/recombinase XerD
MLELNSAAEDHLRELEGVQCKSEHTVKAYRSDLRDFLRFYQSQESPAFDADLVAAYARHLSKARNSAPRTIRRRLSCLRGFCRQLVRRGHIDKSPFDGLELSVPRARSLPRALPRGEAATLANAAWSILRERRPGLVDREMALGVLIALSVGVRIGELTRLKSDDYDPIDGTLHVNGKGSRDRTVFIVDPGLRDQLSRAASQRPGETLLVNPGIGRWSPQSFRNRLRRWADSLAIRRRVTPHMLRHTAATLLLEDGVDVLFLQRLLGHENISTTALYAHVADASLKRALERAGLLASLTPGRAPAAA